MSYWASTPPSRRIAIRSPILIASSTSCVTKTTVFATSRWSRRSSCLEAGARDRVERAERLVHQQHRRVGGERAREADALALAARELRRVALGVGLLEPDELEQLGDARARSAPSASRAAAARCATFSPIVMCGKSPTCWIT